MVARACGRGSCSPRGSQEAEDGEGDRERAAFQRLSASDPLVLGRALKVHSAID